LRPSESAGFSITTEPTIVPMSADATVKPSQNSSNPKSCWMAFSAPEITAVSKPKRRPPKAATAAERKPSAESRAPNG
jgi:hypothetical protein